MPCHINVMNKKTGVTYVYESTSFRDKETKQPRNKRVCIGKLDPVSSELIASKRLTAEQAAIHRILKSNSLKPHKIRYYLEKKDPLFKEKMNEVLIVYKEVNGLSTRPYRKTWSDQTPICFDYRKSHANNSRLKSIHFSQNLWYKATR